jgi:beta-glucosidase
MTGADDHVSGPGQIHETTEAMADAFPRGFLWGASTSAHQIEGNNVGSDLWAVENRPDSPMPEPSGDASDSLHRWPEDLDVVAELGLTAYRFSVEWARIEPARGRFSAAMLAHYRRMIAGCLDRSITPVVTLHHFTCPAWFTALGGWASAAAPELFAAYTRAVLPILDGVEWVCTINEPNMVAMLHTALRGDQPVAAVAGRLPEPDPAVTSALGLAHQAAREVLGGRAGIRSGWSVANLNVQAAAGAQQQAEQWRRLREDQFMQAAEGDDFIGVQAYTRTIVGPDGPLPPGEQARRTLTGWEFYPAALGDAVRHAASVLPGVPILVTENGVATASDDERIEYTRGALAGLRRAMADGADVRGYLHWSLLDNYEWGSYRPTFGLAAVDRESFQRTIKPSGRWLGRVAATGSVPRPGHSAD